MKTVATFAVARRVASGIVLACAVPAILAAQSRAPENPTPPKTLSEPRGFVAEPDVIERAAIFSDRRLGSDGLSSGWKVGFADLAPGAGWASVQTTYRRWGANDRHVAEASAGFSMYGYSAITGRFEYLALADGRVSAGAAFRGQDYRQVAYFGSGPQALETDVSQYRLQSSDLVGYVKVQPARYLDLDVTIGFLNPEVHRAAGPLRRDRPDTRDRYAADPLFALTDQPWFVTSAIALTSDSRDFPGRSLRGGIVHIAATRYSDRTGGTASFRRYEAEVGRFVPFASERVVLAMHGRIVGSNTSDDQFVPFYLQPSLGGQRSLRSVRGIPVSRPEPGESHRRNARRAHDARGHRVFHRCGQCRATCG